MHPHIQQRLYQQRIAHAIFTQPEEAVAWMGAMQGQDYAGAKWSVGLRMAGGSDAVVEQAIADGRIVRTWVMRGTLHLVAAADAHWMVGLLAEKIVAGNARRYKELELDAATLARSSTLLAEALRDGARLTRKALFAHLEAHGISTAGQRGVHMLQRASYARLICQSVAEKNDPTFVALEAAAEVAREEALARLALRYFTSHGPATVKDFAWWSGLAMGEARAALEAVKGQLIGDGDFWMAQRAAPLPERAYLLPGFDEYLLGYQDRRLVLDAEHAHKIVPGGNGVFFPTLIWDGRVVGTWKRAFKKGGAGVQVTFEPFTALTDEAEIAFRAVAARFVGWLGVV